MSESPLDRVRQTAADIFHLAPAKITAQSSPMNVSKWDSVEHLNLVLALEQQYGFEFAPEEIEQMKTIGDIAAVVERKL